jgi:hypothetical protein
MKTLNLFLAVLCLLISNVLYGQEAIPMKGNPEMLTLKDVPSLKLSPLKLPVDFNARYSSSLLEQSIWIIEAFAKEEEIGTISISYEDKYDIRTIDLIVEWYKLASELEIQYEVFLLKKLDGYELGREISKIKGDLIIDRIKLNVAEDFKEKVKNFILKFGIKISADEISAQWIVDNLTYGDGDKQLQIFGITDEEFRLADGHSMKILKKYYDEKFESSNQAIVQFLKETFSGMLESKDNLQLLIEKYNLPPMKKNHNMENYIKELILFFGEKEFISVFLYKIHALTLYERIEKYELREKFSSNKKLEDISINYDIKKGIVTTRETEKPSRGDWRTYASIISGDKIIYSISYGLDKITIWVVTGINDDSEFESKTFEFPMKPGLIDIYAFNTYIALNEIKPGFNHTYSLFDVSFFPEQIFGKKDPEPNYVIADVSFVEETQDADNGQPLYKLLVKTKGMIMNPFWLQYIHKSELPFEGFHMYVTKSYPHKIVNIQ